MVKHSMDLLELLRKRGMDGDVDLLREALRVLVDGIMDAEVSAQIGAQHGERSPERVTYRNGYRNRTWDTRVGTMELHIPKRRVPAGERAEYPVNGLPVDRSIRDGCNGSLPQARRRPTALPRPAGQPSGGATPDAPRTNPGRRPAERRRAGRSHRRRRCAPGTTGSGRIGRFGGCGRNRRQRTVNKAPPGPGKDQRRPRLPCEP